MSTNTVTPNPNGNPFDTPLNSELQEHQQAQQATQAASANGNPFDEPLLSEKAEQQHAANNATIAVPDAGRIPGVMSFGNKVTPKQAAGGIAAGAVAGAAPLVGEAVGSAAKTYLLKKLAEQTPELFGHEAVKETLKRYALEGVRKAATGAAWAGGAELLHSIWDDVFGGKKK